jgi:hypothetical protein
VLIIKHDQSIQQLGKRSTCLSFISKASFSFFFSPISDTSDQFRTVDDIRLRLMDEYHHEQTRIEAALTLTNGLSLLKQYELAKSFLHRVQQEQSLTNHHTFVNGSFINEFD